MVSKMAVLINMLRAFHFLKYIIIQSCLPMTLAWQNSSQEQLGANLINPRNTCLPNNENKNLIAFSPKVNEFIYVFSVDIL